MPDRPQTLKNDFSKLFNPQSVAIIGASSDSQKVGYALVKNLLESDRTVYPVSVSEEKILGQKTHASVGDIAGEVDLAVIAVRADIVPDILEQCGEKGVSFVVIISAGFKEVGEKGIELEKKVLSIAKRYNISLVGPNCLGILNVKAGINASFAGGMPPSGGISFITQSGAAATAFFDWSAESQIGFSKVVSFGNRALLGENDFLSYLANDPETSAIFLYLESVQDGRVFYNLLREITPNKPVVILRGGRAERGARATMSHTGSLAPSDEVCSSALRQAGAIEVFSIREMFNLAKMISSGITKPLRQVAIITNGGGPSIVAADIVEKSPYLELSELSDGAKEALRKILPPMAAINNPIDIIGDAGPERYKKALDVLVKETDTDVVIMMLTPQMMTDKIGTARVIADNTAPIPVIAVFIGGVSMRESEAVLNEKGVPNFKFSEDAVRSLELLCRGQKKASSEKKDDFVFAELEALSFAQSRNLLSEYGLAVEGVLIKEKNELKSAMANINGTVALKVLSQDIMHKTEVQALRLNIENFEEAERAWNEIEQTVRAQNSATRIEGFLLQKMESGTEVIVGAKRDAVFGPMIVFGIGGVLVNLLEDKSMRVAPISEEEAAVMIKEIRGYKLLEGYRGSDVPDVKALAKIIAGTSRLIYEREEIVEIDLNPVMVSPTGARVVDVLILKNKQ